MGISSEVHKPNDEESPNVSQIVGLEKVHVADEGESSDVQQKVGQMEEDVEISSKSSEIQISEGRDNMEEARIMTQTEHPLIIPCRVQLVRLLPNEVFNDPRH